MKYEKRNLKRFIYLYLFILILKITNFIHNKLKQYGQRLLAFFQKPLTYFSSNTFKLTRQLTLLKFQSFQKLYEVIILC